MPRHRALQDGVAGPKKPRRAWRPVRALSCVHAAGSCRLVSGRRAGMNRKNGRERRRLGQPAGLDRRRFGTVPFGPALPFRGGVGARLGGARRSTNGHLGRWDPWRRRFRSRTSEHRQSRWRPREGDRTGAGGAWRRRACAGRGGGAGEAGRSWSGQKEKLTG